MLPGLGWETGFTHYSKQCMNAESGLLADVRDSSDKAGLVLDARQQWGW